MSSRPDLHAAEHALLVAALEAGDLSGPELARAEELLASCPDCAALYADLGILRASVRAMPAPPRRRDFRLSEADVARLRPSGWRRLVDWLAAPRSSVRPLATGLATLGLAGLLLTAVPGLPLLGSATTSSDTSAPAAPAYRATAEQGDTGGAAGAPTEGPKVDMLGAPSEMPAASAPPEVVGPVAPAAEPSPAGAVAGAGQGEGATNGPASQPGYPRDAGGEAAPAGQPAGPSLLALASLALLAAGIGLFAARWAARRAP